MLQAQNNDYKINDGLYKYFLKAFRNQNNKGVGLRMADTLYIRAHKIKDLKAQCLALYLRVSYYHYCNEYEKEREEFKRITPFIMKTPYLQYLFGAWINIIIEDINNLDYVAANRELSRMQTTARHLKNDFGIMRSYSLLGDMYFQQGIHYMAYFQYKKALNYGLSCGENDLLRPYSDIAQACIAMRRWNEAETNLLQSITYSKDLYTLLSPYISLLKLYCIEDTIDSNKIEQSFQRLQNTRNSIALLGNRQDNYNLAMYYYYQFYKNDSVTAQKYWSQGNAVDSFAYYKYRGQYFETRKNYMAACDNYYSYSDYYYTITVKKELVQHALLIPQFEYQKVKLESNELLQKQMKMKLADEKSKARLLALNNEKDRAFLLDKLKERIILQNQLALKESRMMQQSKQITYNRLNLQHKRETQLLFQKSESWRLIFVILISIIILLFIGFFIVMKLRERKKLKQEKEKAENSERTKSLFFQNMNHEIRSPLNAIIGFNEVLCSDVADTLSKEDKESFINMISTNSELLLTLVNDVLDLSNFESGTYKLVPVDVDINTLCHTTLESIRGREAEGVELSFKTGGPFILHTDAQRLQQVLVNYLTNACKYTEAGNITLSYEVLDDIVRFAVTDTGRGVKTEDAEKVFKRFQMLDKSKRGTGLGLHICRLISNLLHGKTYVDTSYTKGARFIFDHPIKGAIAFLIGLFFSFQSVDAQHNEYGIQDRLYPSFETAFNNAGSKDFVPSLQLYKTKADVSKDAKAQFLTQYLEAFHYRLNHNEDKAIKILNNAKVFALQHHLSYFYYLAWYSIIDNQLLSYKSSDALHQLIDFQKSIAKVKDDDIVSLFLFGTANFYLTEHHYSIALSYFKQALNFSKRNDDLIYVRMADCYYYLGKYKETLDVASKALAHNSQNAYAIGPATRTLLCYCKLKDEKNADKVFDFLESLRPKYGSIMSNTNIYQDAVRTYYTEIKKDEKKGQEATKNDNARTISFNVANYRYSVGDYKNAMELYKDYMKTVDAYLRSDNMLLFESFATKFDYEQDLAHKKQLELSNIRLNLRQIENNRQLLELTRQQTRWKLDQEIAEASQKKGEIGLRDSKLAQQRLSMNQQKLLKHSLLQEEKLTNLRLRWMFLTFSILAIVLISSAFAYFLHLKRKDRELKFEADAAIEVEREKNLFFENVNGKIRQPLNTIIELNRTMNKCSVNDAYERSEMMAKLRNSGSYLTKVVNRVLDISKMESGTFKLHYTDIDFRQLCLSELERMRSKVNSGVEIIFRPASNGASGADLPCIINADGEQLQFVLDAYLENALENTLDGSVILSYELFPDKISFSVTDTGVGVDKDMVDKIFYCEKLQSKDAHIGMSLHIVRLLAGLMHGKAYLDTSYSKGARFVFEIPRAQ